MPRDATVVMVGGGIVGATAFDELTAAGHDVTLLERGIVAGGVTAWSGGVVRCMHADAELSRRAVDGFHYFRGLEERPDTRVRFQETGFLYFPAPEERELLRAQVEALELDVPVAWLEREELTRRFGALLADPGAGAVYEPHAGFLDTREATRAIVRSAVARGGRLLEGVELLELDRGAGDINVRTSAGTISADRVVIACGAHTPALLDRLGIEHELYLQDIQVDLRAPSRDVAGHPAFIDDEYGLNGRPDPASGAILLGLPTDRRSPRVVPAPIDPDHSRRIVEVGMRRFSWVATSASRGGRRHPDCYVADGRSYVWAVDDAGDVIVASGFTGGGFKLAPWAAARIACMVNETRRPSPTIERSMS